LYSVEVLFSLLKQKPLPYHLFVNNPSTPTGPRAWILLVLIPTWSKF